MVTSSIFDKVKEFFRWDQVANRAPNSTLGTSLAGPFILKKCIDIPLMRQATESRFDIGFTVKDKNEKIKQRKFKILFPTSFCYCPV
jgi:hypothetical protein